MCHHHAHQKASLENMYHPYTLNRTALPSHASPDLLSPRDSIPRLCSSFHKPGLSEHLLSFHPSPKQALGRGSAKTCLLEKEDPNSEKKAFPHTSRCKNPTLISGCLPRKWFIHMAHVHPAREVFLELSWRTLQSYLECTRNPGI